MHRITRLLGKSICQLATIEHFTRLEQLMADQHGVHLGHDPMMELVHDVGSVIESRRLAAVAYQGEHPEHRPPANHQPKRLWISCDGVMYGTNETEPDPLHPKENRQVWCQMRVGRHRRFVISHRFAELDEVVRSRRVQGRALVAQADDLGPGGGLLVVRSLAV